MPKKYSEKRKQVVLKSAEEKGVSYASVKHGVSIQTIRNWMKKPLQENNADASEFDPNTSIYKLRFDNARMEWTGLQESTYIHLLKAKANRLDQIREILETLRYAERELNLQLKELRDIEQNIAEHERKRADAAKESNPNPL